MSIRKLEIFIEVCRHLNMSKAAQSLFISQSSVSQAIASLEKDYNVCLFERLNHSLYLTDAGQDLLFLAQQVQRSLEQLDSRMRSKAGQNTLRLGACTTIGSCLIHPLLAAYRQKYPDADIIVEIGNSQNLEQKLLTAKLDLAIVQKSRFYRQLQYLPLLTDDLIVICWPGHPLAGQAVSLRQLQDEAFVAREQGSGTEALLEESFALSDLPLKTSWICSGTDAVKQAVMHHAGLAVISRFLVQRELAAGTLAAITLTERPLTRSFELAYHKDKLQDTCFRQFTAFCGSQSEAGLLRLIASKT